MFFFFLQGSPKSPKSGEGGFPAVDPAAGAVIGSGPSMEAPAAPAVGAFNADVSVPEVPAAGGISVGECWRNGARTASSKAQPARGGFILYLSLVKFLSSAARHNLYHLPRGMRVIGN